MPKSPLRKKATCLSTCVYLATRDPEMPLTLHTRPKWGTRTGGNAGKGRAATASTAPRYSSPHRTFRIRAESKRPALPGGMDGGSKLASVRPSARGILNKLLELTASRQQARGEAGSSSSVLGEPLQFHPRRSLPCSIPLLLGSLPAKVSLHSPSPENWLSDRTAYS